jgi:hypothetical protein
MNRNKKGWQGWQGCKGWQGTIVRRTRHRLGASISLFLLIGGLVGAGGWPNAQADGHWAFLAPVRREPPRVEREAWIRNPIDRFILARLEKEGLAPSQEADRTTLLRRLSLDLIGLPPTPEEIDAFLADPSPRAWERQVDRLLASPHYGERWGRWWLDAARYADTNGFEKDRERSIWPYRDWVIHAFQRDQPFDRFTIEQIAGDLLPGATPEQRTATGFLRNSMFNEEGAVEPEQFRIEAVIDRVDAIGKSFLGLTINCAQCHTHKYDPIQHEEYYRFFAFLNQDEEPDLELPTPEEERQREKILTEVAQIEDRLMAQTPDLPSRMAAWEEVQRAAEVEWSIPETVRLIGTNGVKFESLQDHSHMPRGDNPPTTVFYLTVRAPRVPITAIQLELLTDQTLPRRGPGRSTEGLALLSEFEVEVASPTDPTQWERVPLAGASADFAPPDRPIGLAIDGNPKTSWGTDAGPGLRNQDRRAVFLLREPLVPLDEGRLLRVALVQKEFGGSAAERFEAPNLGRFRISLTDAPAPKADPLPPATRAILAIPPRQRTAEQKRTLFRSYRMTVPEWAEANREITALFKGWPFPTTTLVVTPRAVPRETRVFRRGDWKRPGDLVTPGTPVALHPFPDGAPRNRLGLAQWLADRRNPLLPRVIVNRVWQQYFGEGLVRTPEDFGTRADAPTHPELLDWLAVEFRDGGEGAPAEQAWRLKRIHRLIVTSATYRQSSRIPPEAREIDPTNRWLGRAPRLRAEAEVIRDIALAASGLLNLKIGGPPVFPPIPEGALAVSFRSRSVWRTSEGPDRYRRGLYTFWKRSVPYPALSVFDAPNADVSCTRRARSNSPLQALTLLNDPIFMEAAQALALRVWREGGTSDREKLHFGFRLSTGRLPDAFEEERLLWLLDRQRARFAGETAAAVYVSSSDLQNLPRGIDLHQLAPWTIVARTLLNLDETIHRP